MGCCSSKIPTFPPSSTADGIAPTSPPEEFDSQLVKFIPQSGMFGSAVAVYLPYDSTDAPSYFFQGSGGSFKLFKVTMDGKEVAAVIKQGWGISYGGLNIRTSGDMMGNNVTTSAKKTLTVVTKLNGMEHKVKVIKELKHA
jgi:hypothetical protein